MVCSTRNETCLAPQKKGLSGFNGLNESFGSLPASRKRDIATRFLSSDPFDPFNPLNPDHPQS
jgi:hypothetical protein